MLQPIPLTYDPNRTWKEYGFTLEYDGTPIAMPNIFSAPQSGGYGFSSPRNRFIQWVTKYDTLEMVEESLEENLVGNCVRIRFHDRPIVDVRIYEHFDSVVVLVATVSSVHRLTFLHPSNDRFDGNRLVSIFSDGPVISIQDPASFHVFGLASDVPQHATSIVTREGHAVFALALNRPSILLIQLGYGTGAVQKSYLSPASPSGTNPISGRYIGQGDIAVSVVFGVLGTDLILYALCMNGYICVWSCAQQLLVADYNILTAVCYNPPGEVRGIVIRTRSNVVAVNVVTPAHSTIYLLSSQLVGNKLEFSLISFGHCPTGSVISDMIIDDERHQMFCLLRPLGGEEYFVSVMLVKSGKWLVGNKTKMFDGYAKCYNPEGDTTEEIHTVDGYCSMVFSPNEFTCEDIATVLSLSGGIPELSTKSKAELQHAVQTEMKKHGSDELRAWGNFYEACVRQKKARCEAKGLFLLYSTSLMVVVVSKGSFTFYRESDKLEDMIFETANANLTASEAQILKLLRDIPFSAHQNYIFNASLRSFYGLVDTLRLLSFETVESDEYLQRVIRELATIGDPVPFLNHLLSCLIHPFSFSNPEAEAHHLYSSDIGTGLMKEALYQISKTRLLVTRNVYILIQLVSKGVPSTAIFDSMKNDAHDASYAYGALVWMSETAVTKHPDLISVAHHYLSSVRVATAGTELIEYLWARCKEIWPLHLQGRIIAEYMHSIEEYALVLQYRKLCLNRCSWLIIMVDCLLQCDEVTRGFQLAQNVMNEQNFLQIISFFAKIKDSQLLIQISAEAEQHFQMDVYEKCELYSLRFKHFIKFGDYTRALEEIKQQPDRTVRFNQLKELLVTMIEGDHVSQVLTLNYGEMIRAVEAILENAARSLNAPQSDNYYDVLYCLHMIHKDRVKAAAVAFEKGHRSKSNAVQKYSYLFCLHSLNSVEEQPAVIAIPGAHGMEIYTAKDVRREYYLATIRMELGDCPTDTTPREIVNRYVAMKQFTNALRVCAMCDLGLEGPFELLAASCAHVPHELDPWAWLVTNDVASFIYGESDPSQVAWKLLEKLVKQYEVPGSRRCRDAIHNQIRAMGAELPEWLLYSIEGVLPTAQE